MTWQDLGTKTRTALAAVRARVTLRRAIATVLAGSFIGLFAVGTEALIRARISDPLRRMPSGLYTRPVAWGNNRESRAPIAIGSIDGGPLEERIAVPLSEIPNRLIQAVVAVEDQRFFDHHGIDIKRIGGALVANVRAGGIAQGGSTLTQQLAKNLFLNSDRTPLRKVREAAIAVVLEKRYTKAQILEAYLNEIYLGQDGARALHGVGAAARYYFGRDVRKLTLAESALLAAIISAPNRNAPNRHPDVARQRRDMVLQLMVEQHRITKAVADQAARSDVQTRTHPITGFDGRNFRDVALGAVGKNLPTRGEAIYTTLDATLQRAAERAIDAGLDRMRSPDVQGALVAIDPRNGDVLAMVGGHDYGASQFNRATAAIRQPGSAFKPIVALAALDRVANQQPAFTLASVVQDEPLSVHTPSGQWEPVNYDDEFRGPVTLREALEQSLNVPFARIGLAVGPQRIVAAARRVGITAPLDPVPSLALGSSGVTLLELVRAYGVLAAGGDLSSTRVIAGHARYGDSIQVVDNAPPARVIDPAVAYLVTSALEGVIERGTGRALSSQGHQGSIAGKTGTSNDGHDAWFIAYSPTLVVGVWVGFDDGRDLHMTGANAALPIVARFLAEGTTEDDWNEFTVPNGVTTADVGNVSSDWDYGCGAREYFLTGTEPPEGGCMRIRLPESSGEIDWGEIGRAARDKLLRFLTRELRVIKRGTH